MVTPCPVEEAIEVMITENGAIKVVAGHYTLGFTLDNQNNQKVEGNRISFSIHENHLGNFFLQ